MTSRAAIPHIARDLRLKYRTGYINFLPPEYYFMRKYPPIRRDLRPSAGAQDNTKLPYMHLYKKVLQRNPIYIDERVYPAYWKNEPRAMTLAKYQYKYMQAGDDEDAAYSKALKDIDQLESASYEEMCAILKSFSDKNGTVTVPFTADKTIQDELAYWKDRLSIELYDNMDLADQGDVDYFIQTKILKWEEIERERRMRDPVYILRFHELREEIFPSTSNKNLQKELSRKYIPQISKKINQVYNINVTKCVSRRPFFVEDYLNWVGKILKSPNVSKWGDKEQSNFNEWIMNCVAFKDVVEGSPHTANKYFKTLKSEFFPMLNFADKTPDFKISSIDQVKEIMFNNKIGYVRDSENENKLFVLRYYRLPKLLFPLETFAASMIEGSSIFRTSQNDKVDIDHESLLKEVKNVGLDEARIPELLKLFKAYYTPGTKNKSSSEPTLYDESVLDSLLRDKDSADDEDKNDDSVQASSKKVALSTDYTIANKNGVNFSTDPNWKVLAEKYHLLPSTTLEKERDSFFRRLVEPIKLESIINEDDFKVFADSRIESEIATRARASLMYEKKEGARRKREWQHRNLKFKIRPTLQLKS